MEVIEIKPYGYCSGVTRAMKMAEEVAKGSQGAKVFVLGMLVHNEDAIEELTSLGLTVLDERNAPLEDQLRAIPDGSTVLFSAHGHPRLYDEIASKKHLKVFDATCPFVEEVEREGDQADAPLLYLGVSGHLESEAFLANHPGCAFFDVTKKAFVRGPYGDSPLVLSQTTLSYKEVEEAKKTVEAHCSSPTYGKLRCGATSVRQEAVSNIPEDVRTVLVLGSSRSNNTKKLAELASRDGRVVLCARNLEEVKLLPIDSNEKLALVSGASTSKDTFEAVSAYLSSL